MGAGTGFTSPATSSLCAPSFRAGSTTAGDFSVAVFAGISRLQFYEGEIAGLPEDRRRKLAARVAVDTRIIDE